MSTKTKWTKRLVPKPVRRLFEVREVSSAQNIYHCCVHKTASEWVRKLLQDRRTYKYSGLEVFNYEQQLPDKVDPDGSPSACSMNRFQKGKSSRRFTSISPG